MDGQYSSCGTGNLQLGWHGNAGYDLSHARDEEVRDNTTAAVGIYLARLPSSRMKSLPLRREAAGQDVGCYEYRAASVDPRILPWKQRLTSLKQDD